MSVRAPISRRCKTPDGAQSSPTPHRRRRSPPALSAEDARSPNPAPISVSVGIDSEWVTHTDTITGKPFNAILSYQAVLDYGGQRTELIHFPRGKSRRSRITLERLLVLLIRKAIKETVLPRWPGKVVVFCHFLRADITAFDDFWSRKRDFDGFGRTFTASSLAYTLDRSEPEEDQPRPRSVRRTRKSLSIWQDRPHKAPLDQTHRVQVRCDDTMLLTPGRGSLDAAAGLLGKSKVPIPPGFTIDRMDRLLAEDPDAFRRYALQDAHLALEYGLEMQRFASELGLDRMPSTLAGFAMAIAKQEAVRSGFKLDDALGIQTLKRKVYHQKSGNYRTVKERVSSFSRQIVEEFAALAYHGGRGESYVFGPTPVGVFYDYDLPGAYTTAMCLLRPLDYDNARSCRYADEFHADMMGAARVKFRFPVGTRFPCLPVRDNDVLLFPLSGESVCTSPEIALALAMGAEIEVLNGIIIPWASDEPVFASFTERVQKQRAAAGKKTLRGQIWKEIGNSLYGKTAQGVHQKRVFDPRSGRSDSMPPSAITSPWFAMYVTGFIRAVLGEILHGVPPECIVVSATTDGFLTDALESQLKLDGPLCSMFAEVRGRMFGD